MIQHGRAAEEARGGGVHVLKMRGALVSRLPCRWSIASALARDWASETTSIFGLTERILRHLQYFLRRTEILGYRNATAIAWVW